VDGHLYELDGRKSGPINHGDCTEETLLTRAVEVIKGFMARDPEEMRFTIVAFTKTPEADADA
jgi:ubiquitin carboxyl-terminal hydrolase L3